MTASLDAIHRCALLMQGLLVVPDPAAPFHHLFMAIVLYVNDALRGNRGCPPHTKSFPATLL